MSNLLVKRFGAFDEDTSIEEDEISLNYVINTINPLCAIKDIYSVMKVCYQEKIYKQAYTFNFEDVEKMCMRWENEYVLFAAFDDNYRMLAFATVNMQNDGNNIEIIKVPRRYIQIGVKEELMFIIQKYFLDKDIM